MKRIFFISFIFLSVFIKPNLLYSKDLPRVVILETMTLTSLQVRTESFISRLADKGYIDGETIILERYNADKDRNKAKELLIEALKKGKPKLVVTIATLASQEAYNILKETDIPQLFFYVTDPVKAGIIKEMDIATGKNITGIVHVIKYEKLVDIALRLLSTGIDKKPYNIGFLYTDYPSSNSDLLNMQKAEKSRNDIKITPIFLKQLSMPEGIDEMINNVDNTLKQKRDLYDYLWLGTGPHILNEEFVDYFLNIIDAPIIFWENINAVKNGALMAITSSNTHDGRDAGDVAIQILKGVPVGDIPVTRSKNFQLGINLSTANKLGIIVPSDLLELARNNLVY